MGCAPITFSNMQSAKLIDKGKFEYTPSLSLSTNTAFYGLQTAYGLNEKYNLRLRLERIVINVEFEDDSASFLKLSNFNFNESLFHLSFGIKYQLLENKSAIYLPISFTKADNGKNVLKQIEPTIIYTFTLGKCFELNPSLKTLIPINSEYENLLLAYNLGLGISPNSAQWVFRSEMGFLSTLYFDSIIPHFSIGLSIYP